MENFLKEKLIELQGKIETIETIKQEKGENFNIFSILGMERLEVQTHSIFIYELLNPKGTHNQGNLFLNLFIENVLKSEDYKKVLDIKREDLTSDKRRIDFTIETEAYQIGIEMKIDAGDEKNQLFDYFKELNNRCTNNQKVKLFYLTLNGRKASDLSTNGKLKIKQDYIPISFELEIYNWIQACIEKSASLPLVRENLVQYASIIKKITGHTSKETTMEVAKMINNPKIAQAATEMAQNLGIVWAEKEAIFWDKLVDLISDELENNWEMLEPEIFRNKNDERKNITDAIYTHRKDSNKSIEFFFKKTINKKVVSLRLYEYNNQKELFFQLDKIDSIPIDDLAKKLGLNQANKKNRYGSSKIKVNFYGKDVTEPTYDLFDNENLNVLVKETAKSVLAKLSIIDKYFKGI